jgi:hypothetical protein
MNTFKLGQFVEHDGMLAVIVGTFEDGGAPEDHLAVWYGDPKCVRISEGGRGAQKPEVWTIPMVQCMPVQEPAVRH